MTRHLWVLIHRYVGLAMTVFLIIVGLTGSLLVFFDEFNTTLTPHLYPPKRAGATMDAGALAERAEILVPEARVKSVFLGQPGTARIVMEPRISSKTSKPFDLNFNQLFLDPISGDELGRRQTTGVPTGLDNLIPFIYRLHYNLALDKFGMWVLGITALLWTMDCFVGFYLTLPATRRLHGVKANMAQTMRNAEKPSIKRNFWSRWKPAWLVKLQASAYRINFDLHRAGGLWLWIALLIFAWSSVYMNLFEQVYAPVTRLVLDYPQLPWEHPSLKKPLEEPALGWRQAQKIAERLMTEQGDVKGFTVERPVALRIDREHGDYHYAVRSNLDFQDKRGRTLVIFDANTGQLKQLLLPSGQHNGNTVTNWLATLHEANVFAMPYRIFVCILGLAMVMFSVTGVIIWLKKRRSEKFMVRQRNKFIKSQG
ncbi:MAG: PepSY domain-containing protein [Methylotenera sp.]|nr:PepSY domain-containing protein [Methylotenera sp.]